MAQPDPPENLFLAALRGHAGEAALNARIKPMDWCNIARQIGLTELARNAAVTSLRTQGLITYKPETTEIIALTPAGIELGDRLVRRKPKLDDPMPISLEDIQSELDYWEVHLHDGEPESPWWHGVKARIEGLRHRESRFLPGISITNNAIGANSRINQSSIDESTNAVSGTIASKAGQNQLSDPCLPHTKFPERGEAAGAMAFRPLKSFFPTADELLQQDLPTLGKILLTHLNSYRGQNTVYQQAGLNRGYFRAMLENRSIGLGPLPKEPEYQARQPEVTKRMMEAWNWLERQGLLIHNDEQVADWFVISSYGEKCLDQDEAPNRLLQPSSASLAHDKNGRDFDVFISHSSVDKPYVAPLVSALEAAGISVWFDKTTMEWGDSLRSEIDRGLAACRYGIVVFSKAFLRKKKWTEHELNALFAKEEPGKKVILPIWHGITRDDLIEYSPAFADRLAKNSITDTYADIVGSLLSMLGRPNLVSSRSSTDPVGSQQPPPSIANETVDVRHDAKELIPPAARDAGPQDRPTHNVVFLGAAFVKIAYSGPGFSPRTDGMNSFSEIEGPSKGQMIGLVARFGNEAIYGQEIRSVRAVRAHLKLFDMNDQEIGTGFSSALWLGHPSDTYDLVPNGRGGSVLVCWGSKTKARVCWKTRIAIDRLHDNDIELNDGYPGRAEVTLMDSNHRPLLKPIVLEIKKTAGELSVVARQ